MNRRRLLAGVGGIGLGSLAGCLGLAGLDEHEASPAGVAAETREETGYDRTSVDEVSIEEELEVAFYSETVVARNYLTEHEKAVDVGPLGSQRAATFVVLTTPQVSVLGREFNPVQEMSTRELVELIANNYDDVRNVQHDRDAAVTILGQETTASRFSADAAFAGQDLEVDMHVTEAVEAGEDWLVTVGVYPSELPSREEENVLALMEAVTEDVEVDDAEEPIEGGNGSEDDGGGDGSDSDGDGGNERDGDGGNESDGDDENDSDDGLLGLDR